MKFIESPPALAEFVVYGHPQPAGSKKAFAIRKGGKPTGKVAVTDDAVHSRAWKQEVASACMVQSPPEHGLLLRGPLVLIVQFFVARPRGHFGTGRNEGKIRDSAPDFPTIRPDLTKLVRGVEDALTGVLWCDDSQVIAQHLAKFYGEPERAIVVVTRPGTRIP
jgi:Holliday junction resolvase RusA-like endonuclease